MMVLDYSERRQVRHVQQKSRPAVWPYILLILAMLLLAFGAGLGTGWYLFRPGGKLFKAPAAAPVVSPKNSGSLPPQGEPLPTPQSNAPASGSQQPSQPAPPATEKGSAAPPLTFYNTLQKGNKGLMGTGINAHKEGEGAAPKPSSPPQKPER
jgi:hypothetical protein